MLCFESVFSQEKEELLQQNAELRVKLEAKVCIPSQFCSITVPISLISVSDLNKIHNARTLLHDYFYYQKSKHYMKYVMTSGV